MNIVDPLAASGISVAGSHCLNTADGSQERTGKGTVSFNVAVPSPGRSGAAERSGTPGELFPCLTKVLVGGLSHVSGRFVLERHDGLSAEDLTQAVRTDVHRVHQGRQGRQGRQGHRTSTLHVPLGILPRYVFGSAELHFHSHIVPRAVTRRTERRHLLIQRPPSFHQLSGPGQVIRGITKYCPSQLLDSGLVNDSAV
jgi:hypothetical protein